MVFSSRHVLENGMEYSAIAVGHLSSVVIRKRAHLAAKAFGHIRMQFLATKSELFASRLPACLITNSSI